MKAKCDVAGCDYTFSHDDPNQVKRVMGVHKALKHGIAGKFANKNKPARKSERQPEPTAEAPPQVSPNFCPNCGCNLAAIKAALNLRRRA